MRIFHSDRLLRGPLAVAAAAVAALHPWLSLPLLLAAELLERQLFFQSVHAPKMPGHFGPPRHP
jgi:hypothetical protein